MKIILENVIKGARVTGVAKIMDGTVNLNNVGFDVATKDELDRFVDNLLKVQADFATVGNGEYNVAPKEEKPEDPIEVAKRNIDIAFRDLEKEIITKDEYLAVVQVYKDLVGEK